MDKKAMGIVEKYILEHLDAMDAYKKFENRVIKEPV